MTGRGTIWGAVLLTLLLVFSTSYASSRHRGRKKPAAKKLTKVEAELAANPLAPGELLLDLNDGTLMRVKEGNETAQGVWYQRGGVTYLMARDRIRNINRASAKTETESEAVDTSVPPRPTKIEEIWIHLVGGAKMEVDTANESSAGVWYQRGPLNIFIERSRIERIERIDLESIAKSNSSRKERPWTTGNAKIDSLIKQNGAKHGVDPYLIFCVMEQESHFSARALSPKGARGLMQLMPGTGARFGVRNAFNPAENIAGGTRYLKQLMNQFHNRVDLVLASYNAGEGAVVRFGHRVPPYRETRDYVRKISYRYNGNTKKPEAHHKRRAATPVAGR